MREEEENQIVDIERPEEAEVPHSQSVDIPTSGCVAYQTNRTTERFEQVDSVLYDVPFF